MECCFFVRSAGEESVVLKKWTHTNLPLEISFNGMGGILHPWGVYRWEVLYLRNVSVCRVLETRLC